MTATIIILYVAKMNKAIHFQDFDRSIPGKVISKLFIMCILFFALSWLFVFLYCRFFLYHCCMWGITWLDWEELRNSGKCIETQEFCIKTNSYEAGVLCFSAYPCSPCSENSPFYSQWLWNPGYWGIYFLLVKICFYFNYAYSYNVTFFLFENLSNELVHHKTLFFALP